MIFLPDAWMQKVSLFQHALYNAGVRCRMDIWSKGRSRTVSI
jgi:hypothetical protein